jgi:hypothetical protein
MNCSRSKIPSKNLIRQRCAEGLNAGVKVSILFSSLPHGPEMKIAVASLSDYSNGSSRMFVQEQWNYYYFGSYIRNVFTLKRLNNVN